MLNHVINAAILIFVMSAANSDLYIGSRTLYGLAVEGKAPKIFKKVNKMGVPLPSLIMCTAFCALVFLNVSSSSAKGKFLPQYKPLHPLIALRSFHMVRQLGVHFRSSHLDVHRILPHVRTVLSLYVYPTSYLCLSVNSWRPLLPTACLETIYPTKHLSNHGEAGSLSSPPPSSLCSRDSTLSYLLKQIHSLRAYLALS